MGIRLALASRVATALAATAIVAGCTGTAPPSPASAGPGATPAAAPSAMSEAPTTGPAASLAPTPAAAPTVAPSSPGPTPGPIPEAPPVATLRGLVGAAAQGQLGSYTWGSGGSDAPWIVGRVLGTSRRGVPLDVGLRDATPATWTAAWAKVSGGVAGSPAGGASGGGTVRVTAPAQAGDWSLRVTASFGPGHNATYFWHVTITQ